MQTISPSLTTQRKRSWAVGLLILLLLLLDQSVKLWVKMHMYIGEEFVITDWFRIYFVENPGMAYGMKLGSKLFLTIFRIIAMGLLAWLLMAMVRSSRVYKLGFCVVISFIFAGGVGNLLDSIFYGPLFSSSEGQVAQLLLGEGSGYAPWFEGNVVDMLYFPLFSTTLPEWFPIRGGEPYTFFSPIFNVADSYITGGVLALLIFYPRTTTRSLDRLWLYLKGKHRPYRLKA